MSNKQTITSLEREIKEVTSGVKSVREVMRKSGGSLPDSMQAKVSSLRTQLEVLANEVRSILADVPKSRLRQLA